MEPPLWTEGASSFAHEREALAFVRSLLPNHEPYRAWSNVEFIADDGSVNEIDLLVVTGQGVFVVEIKSFPGKLFGDGQRWRHVWPDGRERQLDHPLILTNLKAKRLKTRLGRQAAFRRQDPPFVTALVFLSNEDLDCRLHDVGRTGVTGRDPAPRALGAGADEAAAPDGFAPLPGIVAALKEPAVVGLRGRAVNRPLSRQIAEAVEQAGLVPSNRGRRVGDWEIGELLDEGPGWQDFVGTRSGFDTRRRIRVYLTGATTTAAEEQQLRREADREFKLLESLRHDHIAGVKDLVQAERGPALLFDLFDDEERLDLWAPERVPSLSIEDRIELVRQLTEAIAHAHARRTTHRSLSARSVLVRQSSSSALPTLVVGHWQSGSREMATRMTRHEPTMTVFGEDLADRLATGDQVYLAPEMFSVEDPDPVALDVFSLGSLAYLLLTGQPPADDPAARDAILTEHQGLPVVAAVDGVPEMMELFVRMATAPVPADRETVTELLACIDAALDELTRPDPAVDDAAESDAVDPLSAHQGARLERGWTVLRRLGSGSTAVALLCLQDGSVEPEVLKVAKDEAMSERLLSEARALEGLRHVGVVELFGVEQFDGRTTLRLAPAGDTDDPMGMTLADRIVAQGRVGLDLLERFGDDLLETLGYLESEGVPHRDIKPDNLGVRQRRGDRSLHLVLFDLSLSKAPDTSITAGTPGYLDPFLAERPGRRWDPSADRYAAAATMLEMATGVRPKWGDGRTDPMHLPDEVPSIDADLFDASVRQPMLRFFERALHRRPGQRFDTCDQMRQAWRAVFSDARRPVTTFDDHVDEDALVQLAASATATTPVAELGLSGVAVAVLERMGVSTAEDLLGLPLVEWNRAPGVGRRIRDEVKASMGRLREHLDVEPDVDDSSTSVDRLAAVAVPKSADADLVRALLGLGAQASLIGSATTLSVWPAPAEVRSSLDLDRSLFDAAVARARERWSRQPPITQVRNDIVSLLERSGGVLPGDEIAQALLTQRGSVAGPGERLVRARAVVRAALETEAGRNDRFAWRRLGGGTTVVVALRSDDVDADELSDYAAQLGAVADQLAALVPLPSVDVVRERLRAVPTPPGMTPLPDFRLARLAAASSSTAAVSSRFEMYPRGLEPERALRLARAALLGAGTLSEDDVRKRVAARLPEAQPLPLRPALDHLLEAELGLEWSEGGPSPSGAVLPEGFRVPPSTGGAPSTVVGRSGTRFATGTLATVPEQERAIAADAHERLVRHAANGGYLVLTVPPRSQQRAIDELASYGATVLDGDEWVVSALRAAAERRGIKWDEAIIATDAAGPTGERWERLRSVAKDAVTPLIEELVASHDHVVLTHPGLLARFDRLGLLDELRERLRHADASRRLRTFWVLVPADDPVAAPRLAGKAVPVTTAAEHMVLPEPWLENLHHTRGNQT